MSTHFYYPLGSGSKWENNELRYSLRSLEKFIGDTDVTIAGSAPEWLNISKVQYIPMPEPPKNRLFRVGTKLVAALPYLPDNFIYMNDDYIIMKPIEYFEPIYCNTVRHRISQEMNASHISVHIRGAQNTLEALSDFTDEPLDYDSHSPFPMMRDLVFNMAAVFPFWNDMQLKCIYGNFFKVGGIPGPNHKGAYQDHWRYWSLEDYPTADEQRQLRELLPEPSRYERV